MKSRYGLIVFAVVFLAGLMACATPPTRATRVPSVPTAGEIASRECSILLVKLTPYQYKGTKLLGEFFGAKLGPAIGSPISEEHQMEVGRARSLYAPMTDVQFREHVQRYAAMFQAEKVYYTRFGDEPVAVVATVVKAKFGLARPDGVVWMEDSFFVQIIRDGKPCGVWEAELK